MVAFVADYPTTPLDPATALPVQIYMWANEAERAFVERMSGAIIILSGLPDGDEHHRNRAAAALRAALVDGERHP